MSVKEKFGENRDIHSCTLLQVTAPKPNKPVNQWHPEVVQRGPSEAWGQASAPELPGALKSLSASAPPP